MSARSGAARAGAEYLRRYEPDDDGLRFAPGGHTGAHPDLEPVPDGILGDRIMRARARSRVLQPLTRDDVRRDALALDEVNDLNAYYAWSAWDMLATRATDGPSGMIPRQEYEVLGLIQTFLRYPEITRFVTDAIGPDGVVAIGETARSEIGTKVNGVHTWCLGGSPAEGRCGLLALEWMRPDEWVAEYAAVLKFAQRVLWGRRADGLLFASQDRYRAPAHEEPVSQRLRDSLEWFDGARGLERRDTFSRFNASASLLAFLDHYDCRLGMADAGPYPCDDGTLLLVRDLFVNEAAFHWSDACDGLPYCYTLALLVDAEAMGLREIRVNDISTTFTRPSNYLPYVRAGSVWVRETWDTPAEDVRPLPIADLGDALERIRAATMRLYRRIARTPRRELITNGISTYFVGMILPHLRQAGVIAGEPLYEEACERLELWELDRRVADAYYDVRRRGLAEFLLSQRMEVGVGFAPLPAGTPLDRSKYSVL